MVIFLAATESLVISLASSDNRTSLAEIRKNRFLAFSFGVMLTRPPLTFIHLLICSKVSKGAKIRNQYNQVPHLTQDTNGKVTNSQIDTTNECQEVSPFPAGDHKAHINRRAQRHRKHKTEQKHKRSTKEVPPWNGQ